MKRFFALSFLLLLSVSSFAQIRIEKRHYNRGWYVSVKHAPKANTEQPAKTKKEKHVVPASAIAPEQPSAETKIAAADSLGKNSVPVKVVTKHKAAGPKQILSPVKTQIVPMLKKPVKPLMQPASFGRNTAAAKNKMADPGDSFFGYLFDILRPFLIALGIIILIGLTALLIYGLITNPIATIVTLLVIVLCPAVII